MLKHLIGLANELDRRSLSKEADLVDEIIGAVTSMTEVDMNKTKAGDEPVFDLFIDNKGRAVGAEPASRDLGSTCIVNEENESPSEGDLGESEDDDSSAKELDFHGYKTNNFHMCPGAVKAFSKINQLDLDENSEAIAVGAAKATDDLLGLEEEVIDNKSTSSEQFAEALMLFRVISNADSLDKKGLHAEANLVDRVLTKIAQATEAANQKVDPNDASSDRPGLGEAIKAWPQAAAAQAREIGQAVQEWNPASLDNRYDRVQGRRGDRDIAQSERRQKQDDREELSDQARANSRDRFDLRQEQGRFTIPGRETMLDLQDSWDARSDQGRTDRRARQDLAREQQRGQRDTGFDQQYAERARELEREAANAAKQ